MNFTREQVEKAVKAKGYKWFEGPNYDLNVVGIRNNEQGDKVTNIFDDLITCSFKIDGEWQFYAWAATTDPGKKAMQFYSNPKGVARMVPGQYKSSHEIGLHQGKYEALRQCRNVTVYRDDNKDMVFDETKTDTGLFGINIHRSNPVTESSYVENWSEGCQVFKRVVDFNEFMKICNKAAKLLGNHFTYTLIESTDIK